MNLYLLRHGLAAASGLASVRADRQRPLTAKGQKKMRKIAAAMKRLELSFEAISCSPCLRAKQTAAIVASTLRARKRLEFMDELTAGVPAQALLEALRQKQMLPENLLLVGHEPQLSGLISLLLTDSLQATVALKKGGLCKLTLVSFKPGRLATLEWLLTPKHLARMA
jgi:phosphohistidine phosphatase